MTPIEEARMLAEHGTLAITFPPSLVISIARADLDARSKNTQLVAAVKAKLISPDEAGCLRRYVFLAQHVRKAKTPAELIELALKHGPATASTKLNTVRLYRDMRALGAALAQLQAQPQQIIVEAKPDDSPPERATLPP